MLKQAQTDISKIFKDNVVINDQVLVIEFSKRHFCEYSGIEVIDGKPTIRLKVLHTEVKKRNVTPKPAKPVKK